MEFEKMIRDMYKGRKVCIDWNRFNDTETRYLYYYAEGEVYMVLDTLEDMIIITYGRSPIEVLIKVREKDGE